jgi:hypothetical protein
LWVRIGREGGKSRDEGFEIEKRKEKKTEKREMLESRSRGGGAHQEEKERRPRSKLIHLVVAVAEMSACQLRSLNFNYSIIPPTSSTTYYSPSCVLLQFHSRLPDY